MRKKHTHQTIGAVLPASSGPPACLDALLARLQRRSAVVPLLFRCNFVSVAFIIPSDAFAAGTTRPKQTNPAADAACLIVNPTHNTYPPPPPTTRRR